MGSQPLVRQQAREAFDRRLLIAQAAGQLGLVAGLFLNDRVHKDRNPFELLPMCPGQHGRDLLLEASSPRVLVWHTPRLSRVCTRGYSPLNECVLTSGGPRGQWGARITRASRGEEFHLYSLQVIKDLSSLSPSSLVSPPFRGNGSQDDAVQ